ncbi:MAG: helix-turn-helix transcriptional regulator [Phycisphaerae bacterium]|nr:helix-turn-helix transcriptional regulator [Gemmatimonadaceae bacterium]
MGRPVNTLGDMLRAWRVKDRLSQMALALDAGVSPRHLSFIETGRSRPSPEVLLSIAERLNIPLRVRNELLQAAGYAPQFAETDWDAPDIASVRIALQRLLDAHDPFPGVALDRAWNVVLSNAAAARMVASLPVHVLTPSINMFRASLHPHGFAARTVNFAEWGSYLLTELDRLVAASSDPAMIALQAEVAGYPNVRALRKRQGNSPPARPALLIPCILQHGDMQLSLFTTLATVGSPRDITLAELTVELFYPADEVTAAVLRGGV